MEHIRVCLLMFWNKSKMKEKQNYREVEREIYIF